ncbi:transcription elongation factor a [Anaeramoeba ignava]|uniref:Transcription elongation factor a n=1 Tax=Anaeramoeba ignava TaxID=1746090 RepID=A0A9Q0LU27_ANAIG|nr:transcription elongation factor a [Anaeramoeba ignava]
MDITNNEHLYSRKFKTKTINIQTCQQNIFQILANTEKKQSTKLRLALQELLLFKIPKQDLETFIPELLKILDIYQNQSIFHLILDLLEKIGQLDDEFSEKIFNYFSENLSSPNLGNKISIIQTLGKCVSDKILKEKFMKFLFENLKKDKTEIQKKKGLFSRKSNKIDDQVYIQTACLKVAFLRFPTNIHLIPILIELSKSEDEEAARIALNLLIQHSQKKPVDVAKSLLQILPNDISFQHQSQQLLFKKTEDKETRIARLLCINMQSIHVQISYLRVIKPIISLYKKEIPNEDFQKFYNTIILILKYNILISSIENTSNLNMGLNLQSSQLGVRQLLDAPKKDLKHHLSSISLFYQAINTLSSGKLSWSYMNYKIIDPIDFKISNPKEITNSKYLKLSDYILYKILQIVSAFNFELEKIETQKQKEKNQIEYLKGKILSEKQPEKNEDVMANVDKISQSTLIGAFRCLSLLLDAYNIYKSMNQWDKRILDFNHFNKIRTQILSILNLASSSTIKIHAICCLVKLYQVPINDLESNKNNENNENNENDENDENDENENIAFTEIFSYKKIHEFHILEEVIMKELKKNTFTHVHIGLLIKTIQERINITKDFVPVGLDLISTLIKNSNQSQNGNMILLSFQRIVKMKIYNEILLAKLFEITDSTSDLEYINNYSNDLITECYWFLGEFANELSGVELDSLDNKSQKEYQRRNELIQLTIMRLEHNSSFNNWEIKCECIKALAKIAIRSGSPILEHVMNFFSTIISQPHNKINLVVDPILDVLITIRRNRRIFNHLFEKSNHNLDPNQIQNCFQIHQEILEKIRTFCNVRKDFPTLGFNFKPILSDIYKKRSEERNKNKLIAKEKEKEKEKDQIKGKQENEKTENVEKKTNFFSKLKFWK